MAVQLKHPHTSSFHRPSSAAPQLLRRSACVRVQAVVGGRAEELIKSGAVRPILPKDAASAMESEGYRLLDIRPEWEREKLQYPTVGGASYYFLQLLLLLQAVGSKS